MNDPLERRTVCSGRTMETVCRKYRVERQEISFLRFIFEAYDGIAVLTTDDPREGRISLHIAPGCEGVVAEILADLGRERLIEPLHCETGDRTSTPA